MKIMATLPITSWQIDGGKMETVTDFIFLGSKITVDGDFSCVIKRCLLLGRKVTTNLDSVLKNRDITLLTKVHIVKVMFFFFFFSSSQVWMWELDHKEGWALKNWCFQTGAGEDSWESLGLQGDQTSLKQINPDYFLKGLVLKLNAKKWLFGKYPDAVKDWRQKEKRAAEDGMVGWHHWFTEHEF